jgi:hypothetical protein
MQNFFTRTASQLLVKRSLQRHVPSKIDRILRPSTLRAPFECAGGGYKHFSAQPISVDLHLEEKTEGLLNHIYKGSQGSYTLIHYDRAMEEWSKQCNIHAAERAEDLLVALEKSYDEATSQCSTQQTSSYLMPNAVSYNHVLQAYVLSNGGDQSLFEM